MKRWILRKDESTLASESKPVASFSKQTVCTLHKALINKPKNFILAKFIRSPKNSANVRDKTLILLLSLVFMEEIVLVTQFQPIEYQGLIQIFGCIFINKLHICY